MGGIVLQPLVRSPSINKEKIRKIHILTTRTSVGDGRRDKMTVVILNPKKVIMGGLLCTLLFAGSIMGVMALAGLLRSKPAQAYGGAGAGAKKWYFAEGYTGPGFEEWILIYNPAIGAGGSGNAMSPTVRMYGNGGELGPYYAPRLAPGQRISININQIAQSLFNYSGDISIVVEHPDYPFICERAMYFNYKGQITGGSQVFGYQEGPNE
jgi:hypothetical protein